MVEAANDETKIYFNGIDGLTGDYELPPLSAATLAGLVTGQAPPENLNELRFRREREIREHFGVAEGIDPQKLEETGWGVIFPQEADPAVQEALSALLALRASQAGDYYKVFEYQAGESKNKFLTRYGAGPGPSDPTRVPYYLLLVGSPEAIPYKFQTQLDVQYAVGRIHFNTLQEYANYAQSVVAADKGLVKLPRRATFFGVINNDDRPTQISAENLVRPLYEQYQHFQAGDGQWQAQAYVGEAASKSRLAQILGGPETPALLLTGSHGLRLPLSDKRQPWQQGALICSDWPGPRQWAGQGVLPRDHYFAGEDLTSDTNLLGLIAFFFACFGGGTPLEDEFYKIALQDRPSQIAGYPFMAELPRRMLGLPAGGALAAVGHVERAWGYSFLWPGAGAQTTHFKSALEALLKGSRVGYALEYFNERYAELATLLTDDLADIDAGREYDPYELASLWTAHNDARGYAIIGDPAVKLPLSGAEAAAIRPAIEVQALPGRPQSDVYVKEEEMATEMAAPDGAQKVRGQTKIDEQADALFSFTPITMVPKGYDKDHPELYAAYVEQVKIGYQNSDAVFKRILNAFMRGHYSSLIMNWLLFIIGVGFFVATGVSALMGAEIVPTLIFGGLGTVTFIGYFLTRPTQAVEENLQFIAWLGIIYNTYWTHLMWSVDPEKAQAELDQATETAIKRLKELMDRHAKASGRRPKADKS